jgi:hypothetical protein
VWLYARPEPHCIVAELVAERPRKHAELTAVVGIMLHQIRKHVDPSTRNAFQQYPHIDGQVPIPLGRPSTNANAIRMARRDGFVQVRVPVAVDEGETQDANVAAAVSLNAEPIVQPRACSPDKQRRASPDQTRRRAFAIPTGRRDSCLRTRSASRARQH